MWAVVTKRNTEGFPVEAVPGYDIDGQPFDKAEMLETLIEYVISAGTRILIRFQPNPYVTSKGLSYKPVIRSWCYIHPTKDVGLSDGKYLKDIEVAINDHFSMG